ncbi:MAG: FAD-dependent oxidoreductase, partial [Acidimicrobiia bacterium]
DRWGGPVEHRARLLLEIIAGVRARVGDDFPLWIRINALERHKPDGETFDDQLAVIELAVEAGLDAVHVTAYANLDVATGPTDSYAPHRVGDLADYAAAVRERVDVPVITFGRFEPDEAEQVLAEGRADFVAMGRKLLADPDLPNRLAAGEPERIRPCLYQYRCIGNIFVNQSLACVANAATGREDEAALAVARRSQSVIVVGGGPAGLDAARVLAGQGHHVEVWESGATLGGVLRDVRGADAVLDRYRAWLESEVALAGVGVQLGRRANVDDLLAARPDAVVIATGPRWTAPAVAGRDLPHVVGPGSTTAWFVDGASVPDPVVIVGGGKPGLTLAAALRARGAAITVIESSRVFGVELGLPGRFRMVADIEAAGVRLLAETEVVEIRADSLTVTTAGTPRTIAAAAVVVCTRVSGTPDLATETVAAGLTTFVVGDALAARGFEGITRDAEDLARALAE